MHVHEQFPCWQTVKQSMKAISFKISENVEFICILIPTKPYAEQIIPESEANNSPSLKIGLFLLKQYFQIAISFVGNTQIIILRMSFQINKTARLLKSWKWTIVSYTIPLLKIKVWKTFLYMNWNFFLQILIPVKKKKNYPINLVWKIYLLQGCAVILRFFQSLNVTTCTIQEPGETSDCMN